MVKSSLLLFALLGLAPAGRAQTAALFTGTVTDARTQAPVPYASLGVPGTATGAVANAEGSFRLALPAAADSVVVQALGYAPLRLRLGPALLAAPQALRLTPQPYQLQEATVTGYTPQRLLLQAARTTTRLMASPVELRAYYREFAQTDGQYTKFADAQVDYYLAANPRRPGPPDALHVRVRQSRAGELPLDSKGEAALAVPSPIGVERLASYYDVRHRNDFLDSASFRFYTYALLETGDPAANFYLVRFAPATHEADHLSQGTVHVNRQTLAIESIDAEQPAELTPYAKEVNLLIVKVKMVAASKHIEYRALNGRCYPSFVRLAAGLAVTRKGETFRLDFTSLLLVTDVAPNPAPIPKAEQYRGSLYKNGTQYRTPYWQQGSVVPATAAEEAVIARLALPKSPVK